MPYLMIENEGVCPVEGFTILGLSTSRDQSDKIGQFGSGNKHAILTLIRHGYRPIVYLGRQKLKFFTQSGNMNGKQYERLCYSLSNKNGQSCKTTETSMSLGFGELDWRNIDMALREVLSNALDQTNQDSSKVKIQEVEEPRGKDGFTRVFVEANPTIRQYISSITTHFLQFNGNKETNTSQVLEKTEPGPSKIYRKGVFVRSIQEHSSSIFDYNTTNELNIDECRNASDYDCMRACIAIIGKSNKLYKLFQNITRNEELWESKWSGWWIENEAQKNKEYWKKEWELTFSNKTVIAPPMSLLETIEKVERMGYKVVIPVNEWYTILKKAGIPTIFKIDDIFAKEGCEILGEVPQIALDNRDKVWALFERLELTKGKPKPNIKIFRQIIQNATQTNGFYKTGEDCIYINRDSITSLHTYVEEISHYLSSATDFSRDFQCFLTEALSRVTSLLEKFS